MFVKAGRSSWAWALIVLTTVVALVAQGALVQLVNAPLKEALAHALQGWGVEWSTADDLAMYVVTILMLVEFVVLMWLAWGVLPPRILGKSQWAQLHDADRKEESSHEETIILLLIIIIVLLIVKGT